MLILVNLGCNFNLTIILINLFVCLKVIGSLQCVQDALFQITGRLRETLFPVRPYPPNVEMPPPRPPFMHGVDHRPSYFDRPSYAYGNERPPPGRWSQVGNFVNIAPILACYSIFTLLFFSYVFFCSVR